LAAGVLSLVIGLIAAGIGLFVFIAVSFASAGGAAVILALAWLVAVGAAAAVVHAVIRRRVSVSPSEAFVAAAALGLAVPLVGYAVVARFQRIGTNASLAFFAALFVAVACWVWVVRALLQRRT
jgi:hypothetical protein